MKHVNNEETNFLMERTSILSFDKFILDLDSQNWSTKKMFILLTHLFGWGGGLNIKKK